MKRIILFIIILTLCFSGFSQSLSGDNSFQNKLDPKEITAVSEVKIYPNPCKEEKLTIEFNNREIKEVSLTNIAGRLVFTETFYFLENKKQIQLNDIPNGLYFIKVKTSDNKIVVKKLMVSKI